jgi:hypothetical protein
MIVDAWPRLQLKRCCAPPLTGEIHDEAAIKAVQNAATSKLSASSTVRKRLQHVLCSSVDTHSLVGVCTTPSLVCSSCNVRVVHATARAVARHTLSVLTLANFLCFFSVQAVRHQAAAVVAALALSSPPLLAVLFGECLEGVETFCQQLMLLAAPYTKRGPVPGTGGSMANSTGTGALEAWARRAWGLAVQE